MVQLLLNAGADDEKPRSICYSSAVEFAEQEEHYAVANFLKDYQK